MPTKPLTPAERFAKFDAYEIHPCTLDPDPNTGKLYYDQCEPNDPNLFCWSLYGHIKHNVQIVDGRRIDEGGLDCIADFATEAEAEYMQTILESILPAAVNALNLMDITTNALKYLTDPSKIGYSKEFTLAKKDAKAALTKGAPWII